MYDNPDCCDSTPLTLVWFSVRLAQVYLTSKCMTALTVVLPPSNSHEIFSTTGSAVLDFRMYDFFDCCHSIPLTIVVFSARLSKLTFSLECTSSLTVAMPPDWLLCDFQWMWVLVCVRVRVWVRLRLRVLSLFFPATATARPSLEHQPLRTTRATTTHLPHRHSLTHSTSNPS
jgi:hypothetical protein